VRDIKKVTSCKFQVASKETKYKMQRKMQDAESLPVCRSSSRGKMQDNSIDQSTNLPIDQFTN